MAMNALKHLCLVAAFGALPGSGSAAPLNVAEVAASEINCAFQAGCAVVTPDIYLDFIAVQNGDVITFTFEKPVCAANASDPGQVSSLFGLASSSARNAISVKAGIPGADHIDVKALAPMHY